MKKNAKASTPTRSTTSTPKKKTTPQSRRTSWHEGDPAPDSPVVEELHVENITYQRKFISCGKERCKKGCASGKASHGPYWYAIQWNPKTSKTTSTYVGKNAPGIHQIAAQVGAEL
jgi:hypothetical protein